ncbi:hypothetical protein [Herbaspirillum huttiense]|uniref:hypothetical protein n=1 Tax=Herbaspirillum huttiense TaxID=863372 RepID=UPI0039B0CAB2
MIATLPIVEYAGSILLLHESAAAVEESAAELHLLGSHARKLIEQCVEQTSLKRTKLSKAAEALDHAGFIKVVESEACFDRSYTLSATLVGEEALLALEHLETTGVFVRQRKAG